MGPAYNTAIPAVITTYNLFMAPYPRFTTLLITAPTSNPRVATRNSEPAPDRYTANRFFVLLYEISTRTNHDPYATKRYSHRCDDVNRPKNNRSYYMHRSSLVSSGDSRFLATSFSWWSKEKVVSALALAFSRANKWLKPDAFWSHTTS
jgi:hypothetical protein